MKSDEAIVSALKQTKFVVPGAAPLADTLSSSQPCRGVYHQGSAQGMALLPAGGMPHMSLMDAGTHCPRAT